MCTSTNDRVWSHSHLDIEIPPCACEKTQDHIQYPINHLGPWKNNGLTTGNTLAPSSNPKLYWRISTAYPHVSFSWVVTTWSQMFFHQNPCKYTKIPCIPSIIWVHFGWIQGIHPRLLLGAQQWESFLGFPMTSVSDSDKRLTSQANSRIFHPKKQRIKFRVAPDLNWGNITNHIHRTSHK